MQRLAERAKELDMINKEKPKKVVPEEILQKNAKNKYKAKFGQRFIKKDMQSIQTLMSFKDIFV